MRNFRRHWLIKLAFQRGLRLICLLPLGLAGLFALVSAAPVDPVGAYVGARTALVGHEQRAAIAAEWGLDAPAWERFWIWTSHILSGDLGASITFSAPVSEVIATRAGASLSLLALAFVLSLLLGAGLGLLAAAWREGPMDRAIRAFAVTLSVSPSFWIGLLLLSLFAVSLGWLPVCCSAPLGLTQDEITWSDRLRHLVLPATAVAVTAISGLILHCRAIAIEVLESPPAQHLAAHGMGPLSLIRHLALRHVAGPALAFHFAAAGELIGGSILAETLFTWPGLGQAVVMAANGADAPLLLGIALISLILVFTGNLIAEILANLLDPRRRIGL